MRDSLANLIYPPTPDAAATNGWLNGTAITSVTNNAVAPDGTTTATKFVGLTGNSNNSSGSSLRWLNGATETGRYTLSFLAQAAIAGETVRVRFVDNGAGLDTTVDCSVTDGGNNVLTTTARRYSATVDLPAGSTTFYSILYFSGTVRDKWIESAQLNTELATALESPVVRGIYFVKLAFDSGNACWHSGFGDISFGGDTYLGVGTLSTVSALKEESGVKASGARVGLSGIKEEIVSMLLSEPYINRKAYIYFMPLDDGDQPVSATPYMLFRGTMDDISGTMGSRAGFDVTLKSRFADWERSRKSLYTDVEQQRLYPGDRGLEYVAQLSQKKIIWPLAAFLPDARD